jgi:hypothetical protein
MADVTSEALAAMAKQGRTPMGKDGIKFSTQGPKAGKLVPKTGNAKAGDPTGAGTKVNRQNAMPTQAERNGAAYRPMTARYTKQTDPSAGFTQANGNIIKTAVYRSRPNFDGGSSSSY